MRILNRVFDGDELPKIPFDVLIYRSCLWRLSIIIISVSSFLNMYKCKGHLINFVGHLQRKLLFQRFLLKRYRFKCNYEIFNELGTSSSFCSLSFVIISLVTIMKNHHDRCLIVDFDLGLSLSLSHTPARAHTRAGVLLSFNSYLGSQCRFGLWSRPHFELDWFLPLEMFVAKALQDLVAL